PATDTTALENEIDRLVYELYGLTEEEIEIVEGAASEPSPRLVSSPTTTDSLVICCWRGLQQR
ncbi:MAG: hypothetical protein GXO86_00105, partial [Chlorobi bacterium]|nr:hypothetical protein [Chlorobiota bacterium]